MSGTLIKRAPLEDGTVIFYREAKGPEGASTVLLLHGFPSSSHQFRHFIPLLAQKYRVIAPDMPGFGFTTVPSSYEYTFENMATSIGKFLDALHIERFAMYIFDFGAPVGLRLALHRPDAIRAIISQNGNAYEEGLGQSWEPVKAFWTTHPDSNAAERESVHKMVTDLDFIKDQYGEDARRSDSTLEPESYTLDHALINRPGMGYASVDMLYDYQNNVKLYPQFQAYFRKVQVPILAVWGQHDGYFIPAGAHAFQRDVPQAEVKLLDAGHFAVETKTREIADLMVDFLERKTSP